MLLFFRIVFLFPKPVKECYSSQKICIPIQIVVSLLKRKIVMKRLSTILFILFTVLPIFAQTENKADQLPDFDSPRYKDFGGFILDMGPMVDVPFYLAPPTLSFRPFDYASAGLYEVSPEAVRINPNLTYLGGTTMTPSPMAFYSLLYPGSTGNVQWQGASFKLNNGVRINTYGEYDADGYKVYNPSAMPWERNNFNAAFEVKSPNGKFGIKVEFHGGRNYPY